MAELSSGRPVKGLGSVKTGIETPASEDKAKPASGIRFGERMSGYVFLKSAYLVPDTGKIGPERVLV
jgi:hypothetical protein